MRGKGREISSPLISPFPFSHNPGQVKARKVEHRKKSGISQATYPYYQSHLVILLFDLRFPKDRRATYNLLPFLLCGGSDAKPPLGIPQNL